MMMIRQRFHHKVNILRCVWYHRGTTRRRVTVLIFRTLHLTTTRSAEAAAQRTCRNYEIISRNTSTISATSTVQSRWLNGVNLMT